MMMVDHITVLQIQMGIKRVHFPASKSAMELTRKGFGGGVWFGLILAVLARLSLYQRARGQPLQTQQMTRRRKRTMAEMAGTMMYSQRSARSWDRQPERQEKKSTLSYQSARLRSSLQYILKIMFVWYFMLMTRNEGAMTKGVSN